MRGRCLSGSLRTRETSSSPSSPPYLFKELRICILSLFLQEVNTLNTPVGHRIWVVSFGLNFKEHFRFYLT